MAYQNPRYPYPLSGWLKQLLPYLEQDALGSALALPQLAVAAQHAPTLEAHDLAPRSSRSGRRLWLIAVLHASMSVLVHEAAGTSVIS